jgi:hypothetical protein
VGQFEQLPPTRSVRETFDRLIYTLALSRRRHGGRLRGFATADPAYPPADFDSTAAIERRLYALLDSVGIKVGQMDARLKQAEATVLRLAEQHGWEIPQDLA